MNHVILAIDPGASGGIVELWPDGKAEAMAMPDDAEIRDYLEELKGNATLNGLTLVCFLEIVGGFIKGRPAPGSAMFNFGNGYGYLRGCLAMARIETRLVRPQAWQAGIAGVQCCKEKADRKRALKEHAARIFPALKVTLSTSDALCIADYARHELQSHE